MPHVKPTDKRKLTPEERYERSQQARAEVQATVKARAALKKQLEESGGTVELSESLAKFSQLPLSTRTVQGLERGGYKHLTHIQAESLPYSLTGRDVLGAAKTGSGKTLAFVIPVLERLYVENWDGETGLGALILAPTRELALQTFKVLQVVGIRHPFSAALLTGGRNVDEEKKRLHSMCVVVGTPGRVLHHLTEASSLSVDNLQVLVLDEADRLLDMGFAEAVDGILEHLPSGESRQTLLFSATQTTEVQRLAQLCLHNPVSVAAHASTVEPTPQHMCQNFIVSELHQKLDVLFAFLRRHPNDKTIVFVNTCNQVKFMYLALSKMLKKSRVPTMCLTGKMKQFRRDEVFLTFCRCKSAVLFCTDIAARGLDFPLVHWVVQYDCPESVETYIHRAGRTARAGARGVTLLMLTPSEKAMLQLLHAKKVPLREIAIRPTYMQSTQQLLVALVVQGLKYDAQKAFISYLRSLTFASNKSVFRLQDIDVEKFSQSLGLLVVPDMSAISESRFAKNLPWAVANFKAESEIAEQKTLTRRERHLTAADMFKNSMEAKTRYAPKEAVDPDADDEPWLKKKPQAEKQPTDASKELTFDERLAGLSKNKKRAVVDTADLKIRDLNLAKRTVFSSDDDETEAAPTRAPRGMTVNEFAEIQENDDSDSDGLSEHGYAANLKSKLQATAVEDAERVKALKRTRRDAKAGRSDADAADDDSDASSAVSFDSVTQRMLAAARGELPSSSDEDEDEVEEPSSSSEDEGPTLDRKVMMQRRRHRAE